MATTSLLRRKKETNPLVHSRMDTQPNTQSPGAPAPTQWPGAPVLPALSAKQTESYLGVQPGDPMPGQSTPITVSPMRPTVGQGASRAGYANPDDALMNRLDAVSAEATPEGQSPLINPAERREVTPVLRRMAPQEIQTNSEDDYEASRLQLRREGVRGVVFGPGSSPNRQPDPTAPKAVFDPAKVYGAMADAEQGLLRRNGGQAPVSTAAPGTIEAGPAIMAARAKQKDTMADMAYGFASPMSRRRIAQRESTERQEGLMRTRQENAAELSKINAGATVAAAAAGAKPVEPIVNIMRNKKFDPDTGKVTEEYDVPHVIGGQGAELDAAGRAITPADIRQQKVAEAVQEAETAMEAIGGGPFGGYKGNNKEAAKKIDAAIMNAATVAFGRDPTQKEMTLIQTELAKGTPLKFLLDQAMTSARAAKP